jgi:carbamoyltransferase
VNVVGISAFYHEAACCLLRDGRLVAAAEEERFTRIKHDPRLPVHAFRFCLQEGGVGIEDLDAIGYYESPVKKLSRQLWAGPPQGVSPAMPWLDALRPEREIRETLGWDGPLLTFEHHLSHAASAFDFSGYDEAAILTVDGVGEWATTTYGRGDAGGIELFEQVEFPHSLGLLYSTITGYLGFRVNDGEYKVMGLAPYGQPRYLEQMRALLRSQPGGQYRLDLQYFDFLRGTRMHSERLSELLGGPQRAPESEITQRHQDIARSLQLVLEETLLEKARWLHERVPSKSLCMSGGVALNCVANGRLLREGPFQRLFVQPAAGDAGGALGAAALAHARLAGARVPRERLRDVYLGPRHDAREIAELLEALGVTALDFREREGALLEAVVDRLAAGRVIGWFHGAMEFGPRALGARSILADPRDAGMRERLNRLVKKREAFRPFAPSVLQEHASAHFELDHPSEFMLETCQVRSPLDLPAITHVDGSARPQTVDAERAPRYAALIRAFAARTGCPLLVNTSFNVRGEPIACSPTDALITMAESDIDCLVLEDFVLDREALPEPLLGLLRHWNGLYNTRGERPVSSTVYTFL